MNAIKSDDGEPVCAIRKPVRIDLEIDTRAGHDRPYERADRLTAADVVGCREDGGEIELITLGGVERAAALFVIGHAINDCRLSTGQRFCVKDKPIGSRA